MSWMFRSLSARLRRGTPARAPMQAETSNGAATYDLKKFVNCKVLLLDGTHLSIVIPRNATGSDLFEEVFYSLDIEERDYFGLQYTDQCNVQHWLDQSKKVVKQIAIGPPYTLRFRVKFFTCEPSSNLKEELTRYQFFLQLKNDVANGRLACQKSFAVDLAAFALQSELGDYNPVEHTLLFISTFRFHPEQDEKMEIEILEKYKACRGQTPAQAELNFLNKARWLEMYGVDMHIVEGKDRNTYHLGLTPQGMLVFDGGQKIGLFLWEKLQKLDFRNKKITLVVEEDADVSNNGQIQLHTFVFNLASEKACKHFWKCAIEQHTFFRLKSRPVVVSRKSQLFRLGSTFKYRGRTEYETVHKEGARLSRRTSSTFERRPSQRYTARKSHAMIREAARNELRQQVLSAQAQSASHSSQAEEVTVAATASQPQRVTSTFSTASTVQQSNNQQQTQQNVQNIRPDSSNHVTKISVGNLENVQQDMFTFNDGKSAIPSSRIPRLHSGVNDMSTNVLANNSLSNNNYQAMSRIPRMMTSSERSRPSAVPVLPPRRIVTDL